MSLCFGVSLLGACRLDVCVCLCTQSCMLGHRILRCSHSRSSHSLQCHFPSQVRLAEAALDIKDRASVHISIYVGLQLMRIQVEVWSPWATCFTSAKEVFARIISGCLQSERVVPAVVWNIDVRVVCSGSLLPTNTWCCEIMVNCQLTTVSSYQFIQYLTRHIKTWFPICLRHWVAKARCIVLCQLRIKKVFFLNRSQGIFERHTA